MKKKNRILKTRGDIIFIVSTILVLCLIVSFIDVNLHNLTNSKEIADWNLFKIFLNLFK